MSERKRGRCSVCLVPISITATTVVTQGLVSGVVCPLCQAEKPRLDELRTRQEAQLAEAEETVRLLRAALGIEDGA